MPVYFVIRSSIILIYMKSKTKALIAIAVLIIIAAAALLWQNFSKRQPKGKDEQEQQATLTGKTPLAMSQVSNNQLPELLPKNLPVEKGAEVLENYEFSDASTGQRQSTRSYATKKSPEENVEIYKKYLLDNQWSAVSVADGNNQNILTASKGGGSIIIVVRNNAADSPDTVSVSVTGSR